MKTNMKMTVAFAALIAAFAAEASPVLERDAQYAAKGWSVLNAKAFGSLGDVTDVTAETNATGDVKWYVVKMTKGAAVVAPDDEIEPVIAVMPGSDGVIPAGSPLRAMLERDMTNRLAYVSKKASGKLKLSTSSASTSDETAKWNKLRQYGRGRVLTTSAAGGGPSTIVRWLDGWNVESKVGETQTLRFWNQSNSTDYFTNDQIFNLYTPGNCYCGCVATAGASVMHYFRVPSGNAISRDCTYNGTTTNITAKGGSYDWSLIDKVNLQRGNSVTLSDKAVDLLAKVAFDCGVGCGMMYGDTGSGSYTYNLGLSFRDVFDVQNVQLVTKGGGNYGYGYTTDIGPANYANIIYNQIRGGAPVVLGIDGHEVVACGYGYDDAKTDYTYVFLGWGGYNDAWYALPTVDTKATAEGGWYTSTFIDELLTEIAPFDDKFVAVVGQVVDADGEPMPGETVTLASGETLTTDENGYFGTRVSPTDPCYVTDSLGEKHTYTLGYAATSTTEGGKASDALAADMPDAMTIELLEPAVRVGGDDSRIYGSLTRALEVVKKGETVEILKPTILKKPVVVTNDCTIFATNAVAAEAMVRWANHALITVTNGVTVTISNVCIGTEAESPMFKVLAGGTLRLGSHCRMGAIETANADGLVVAGALTDSLYVTCAGATKAGSVFAKYATDYETATDCAHFLLHPTDTHLGGAADGAGNILWSKDAPVPDDAAVAKTVIGGASRNYRAVDDIIDDVAALTEPLEIVVVKDGTLTKEYALKSSSVTIRGEGVPRPVLTVASTAGFASGTGTALTIKNVTFLGTEPQSQTSEICFIKVDGGAVTFGDGATLNGIIGRIDYGSGVVELNSGTVTMEGGASIINCEAQGLKYGTGWGGAIYAKGKDCQLNLLGGVITNCFASSLGGGVYTYVSGVAAEINVKGDLTIADNASNGYANDDIYLRIAQGLSGFKVTGLVNGRVGVRYAPSIAGNAEGDSFITNAIGDGVDETTLYSFFSDATSGMVAAKGTGDMVGTLVWAADKRDPRQCDESEASAKLIAGSEVTFWREVSDALNEATDDCIVEVLANNSVTIAGNDYVPLAANVAIKGKNVTLRSAAGAAFGYLLLREKDVQIKVADGSELVVTNLDIRGCELSDTPVTNTVTLFDVDGGKLTLDNAGILYVFGDTNRNANAITVYNGGTLTMRNGAQVDTCYNLYKGAVKDTENGAGGGILIENSTAYLRDAYVSRCLGWKGGGVFACNGSKVYVSGRTCISASYTPDYGTCSNLELSNNSELILDGELTGFIMETPPYQGDTNLVATVDYAWDVTSLTNSAAGFERDIDGELAVAVTNGTKALIVWCGAVKDGVYTNVEGNTPVRYALAGEMPVAAPPISGYQLTFGTASAFVNDPVVEITSMENDADGIKVTVLVKDGTVPVAVDATKVAVLFEATSDVSDWTKTVGLTVENPVQNADDSVTFDVKPVGDPPAVFIRLKY